MTATPRKVLVAGASGGIGQAFCQQLAEQFPDVHLIRLARHTDALLPLNIATQDISFDLTDEASMITALQALPDNAEIDWVFIATGWLHDHDTQPEKHPTTIGILSARVGSISDNRLGGWHSYRASKAALNMLIKNFAIELNRMKRPTIIVGLQPGTTATALSAPFQRNVSPDHLQTPEFTASHLLNVMQTRQLSDSGQLFDFMGLPFAP